MCVPVAVWQGYTANFYTRILPFTLRGTVVKLQKRNPNKAIVDIRLRPRSSAAPWWVSDRASHVESLLA